MNDYRHSICESHRKKAGKDYENLGKQWQNSQKGILERVYIINDGNQAIHLCKPQIYGFDERVVPISRSWKWWSECHKTMSVQLYEESALSCVSKSPYKLIMLENVPSEDDHLILKNAELTMLKDWDSQLSAWDIDFKKNLYNERKIEIGRERWWEITRLRLFMRTRGDIVPEKLKAREGTESIAGKNLNHRNYAG